MSDQIFPSEKKGNIYPLGVVGSFPQRSNAIEWKTCTEVRKPAGLFIMRETSQAEKGQGMWLHL